MTTYAGRAARDLACNDLAGHGNGGSPALGPAGARTFGASHSSSLISTLVGGEFRMTNAS